MALHFEKRILPLASIPSEAERFDRTLSVRLTDDETIHRATTLAQHIANRAELEIRAKGIASQFKEDITEHAEAIVKLGRVVATKEEHRSVQCATVRDEDRHTMLTVRLDTGEVVDSRAMTPDERQPKLFPIDGAKARRGQKGAESTTVVIDAEVGKNLAEAVRKARADEIEGA